MRDLGSIDFVFLPLGSWFDVLRGPSAWLCLVRWTGYDHSSISASGKRSRWPTLRYGIASRSTSFLAWRSVIFSHSHSSSSVSMRAPFPYARSTDMPPAPPSCSRPCCRKLRRGRRGGSSAGLFERGLPMDAVSDDVQEALAV